MENFIVNLISFIVMALMFLLIIGVPVGVFIWCIKTVKKESLKKDSDTSLNTVFSVKSYFLGTDYFRKKDGKVERGDCEICIDRENLYIKQNNEVIENYLGSVYLFDIWEYKGDIYFKFQMSNRDYKFRCIDSEADKIVKLIRKNDLAIEIEDNRYE